MKYLEHTIYELLNRGENLVIATILARTGSTPRTAGSKMLIRQNGQISGTIGGGLVEAQVTQKAGDIFQTRVSTILSFDLRSTDVRSSMDLICGGQLEVLVEYVPSEKNNLAIYNKLFTEFNRGMTTILAGMMNRVSPGTVDVQRFLITEEGLTPEALQVSSATIEQIRDIACAQCSSIVLNQGESAFIAETINGLETVYLFGAGHVSQEVARLTQRLEFRTVVVDDRKEFCNADKFKCADELLVVDTFDKAFAGVDIHPNSYIAIMTRGHSHDKVVLAEALKSQALYIGMIGSRRKRELIFKTLLEEGYSVDDLKRVHSPIGLSIDAESPAELAVSIVAELIQKRAEARKN